MKADGSRPGWPIPEAVITAVPAPDDGCQHPKHVELPTEIQYTEYSRIFFDKKFKIQYV